MAVTALLNVKFRIVNCWFPMAAAILPPKNTRSFKKPAEPATTDVSVQSSVFNGFKHTVLDKYSLMLSPSSLAHPEDKILEACRLRGRPMNRTDCIPCRDSCRIKLKISDLTIEDIGRAPILIRSKVWISIDDVSTRETSYGFQSGHSVGVTDQLSIIVVEYRIRYRVSSGWKVYKSWRCRRRCTALSATASSSNCSIDGSGIVCDSIA